MTCTIQRIFYVVFLLAMLSGCGGGSSSTETSGGNGGNQTEPVTTVDPEDRGTEVTTPADTSDGSTSNQRRPLVDAGRDQYADSNVVLTLSGAAQGRDGAEIIHTQWIQRYGPEVDISSSDELSNILVAPDVTNLQRYTFELIATDSNGNTGSDTVNLFINPLASSVRITSNSVNESAREVVLRVILSQPQSIPLVVNYATQDGSARSGSDFVRKEGSLSFQPGEVEKTIRIDIRDDASVEADELFYVRITNVDNGTVAQSTGTVVIHGGESGNPQLQPQAITFMNQGPVTSYVGDTLTNTARAASEAQSGTGQITYVSGNEAVATINPTTGAVEAHTNGQTIITALKAADASFQGARASYTLVVSKRPQQLSFTNPGPVEIEIYDSQFNQVIEDAGLAPGTGAISYLSSRPEVVSVDPITGEVEALALGDAVITAIKAADETYALARATYLITSSLPSSGRLSQTIAFTDAGPLAGTIDDTIENPLAITGSGSGNISYFSNQADVASVDANGLVTLTGAGTALITASKAGDDIYQPATDTYEITVAKKPQSISFVDPGPIAGLVGQQVNNPITIGSPGSGLVTFTSSNASVAFVDPTSGAVTLTGAGSATITATKAADTEYQQTSASYSIDVIKQPQTLTFEHESITGNVNETYTKIATGQGSGAISYSSSDDTIATVDSATGILTLVGGGNTVISAQIAADATYQSATASYNVTVNKLDQTLIFQNAGPLAGQVGSSITNTATSPGTGEISYQSNNLSVATVNSATGQVSLVGAGNATITASIAADAQYNQAVASYTVNAALNPVSMQFETPGTITGDAGSSHTNPLIVTPLAAANNISFSSSNPSIASVNSISGLVTLHSPGSVQITATKAVDSVYGAATASYSVQVNQLVQNVTFDNPGPVTGYVNDKLTNIVTGPGTGAVTYDSNNQALASVNSSTGEVTLLAEGSVIITATKAADATYQEATSQYSLNIFKNDQVITFVEAMEVVGYIGGSFANPASGQGTGAISYSSANPAIASVDNNGTISFVSSGSTTITATIAADNTYNGASASFSVNVSADSTPDPFTFISVDKAPLNTIVTSNTETITGIAGNAPISITGGEYSINGAGYTQVSGTISANQQVTVRTTTPGTFSTQTTVTLTVGSVSTNFEVTTDKEDIQPDSFSFNSQANVDLNTLVASPTVVISGFNAPATVSISNGEYSVRGEAFTSTAGTINPDEPIQVRLTSANTVLTATTATLNIGGVTANFVATTRDKLDQVIAFFDPGAAYRCLGDSYTNSASVQGQGGSGSISYSSSNTGVATISNTGYINIVGAGSTTITANIAADAGYNAAQTSFSLSSVGSEIVELQTFMGENSGRYTLPASTSGLDLYRSSVYNCDIENYSTCNNGNMFILNTTSGVDVDLKASAVSYYRLASGKYACLPIGGMYVNHYRNTEFPGIKTFDYARPLLVFKNKLITFGASRTMISSDAIHWSYHTNGLGYPGNPVVFNNKILMYNRSSTTVSLQESADGINWTPYSAADAFDSPVVDLFDRDNYQMVEFNGYLWLIGGFISAAHNRQGSTDILRSSDGRNWTTVASNVPFGIQLSHKVVAYAGSLYLFAFNDYSVGGTPTQVWKSANGINWNLAASAPPFQDRGVSSLAILDNKMFAMTHNRYGDTNSLQIWTSTNGISWSLVRDDIRTLMPKAVDGDLLVSLTGKLWLFGGWNGSLNSTYYSWRSSNGINWDYAGLWDIRRPIVPQ